MNLYYVESPAPFTVTLPGENLFGAPPGSYEPSGAVGIYLMLSPLPVGQHVIHFTSAVDGTTLVNVTDNLTVKPPGR